LLARDPDPSLDGVHYLVGMGYEQSGAIFRVIDRSTIPKHPIENDAWYRLLLATLHYLSGGYRVQALCSRRAAAQVAGAAPAYAVAARLLAFAFEGGVGPTLSQDVGTLTDGFPTARESVSGLVAAIRRRADVLLSNLGERNPNAWAQQHSLDPEGAGFWGSYLHRLRERGITSFTREQGTFDRWLKRDVDLLVQLPTGAGKSIVGELLTALHLAAGVAVVWLLPTRALVRQFKRDLARAFSTLNVDVEELPTTEDALPLFVDDVPVSRQIAVTTPERLSALVRANPSALSAVGLVVFDEAQLLLDKTRGVTAEHLLRLTRTGEAPCRLALMTGFPDAREPLERAMRGLGSTPHVLVSEVRPTRRIYGAVTDEKSAATRARVTVLVHAPRTDAEHLDILPFSVHFRDGTRKPSKSPTKIAERLAKSVHSAEGFRSVFFLGSRRSADSQAGKLAKSAQRSATKRLTLPAGSVARLRLELGRKSSLEATAPQRVASHHGGLAPLEQHLVERWLTSGAIRTLFATPTLAQGVNLPFNLSVVTYTHRFNEATREHEPVPVAEIMNMLGRAGRAGRVADGLCLLALESTTTRRTDVMRRSASIYFARPVARSEVGLASLLIAGYPFMGSPEWPRELNGVSFSDAQTLTSLALDLAARGISDAGGVRAFLEAYPSVLALDPDVRNGIASRLALLIENTRVVLAHQPVATQVAVRTGLPPEYCMAVVDSVQAAPLDWEPEPVPIAWCDDVVRSALERTATREWQRWVLDEYPIETVLSAVATWRSAAPLYTLEKLLARDSVVSERSRIGDFLNHHMSAIAPLWAAIPVAAEVLERAQLTEATRPAPTLVRDGIPTTDALVWLRSLGGIDRVLAREVSSAIPLQLGSLAQQQREARLRVSEWQARIEPFPQEFAVYLEDVLSDEQ
jgi:hypothetical protein